MEGARRATSQETLEKTPEKTLEKTPENGLGEKELLTRFFFCFEVD